MNKTLIVFVCLAMVPFAVAGEKTTNPSANSQLSAVLEAKVKKAWEDFKNKDKNAFAAILAHDFREVEDDGGGFRDANAEIAEIDAFDIANYTLSDFSVHPIGPDGALVNYVAQYSGSAGGQKVEGKVIYAEIWVKRAGTWKTLYAQSTNVK